MYNSARSENARVVSVKAWWGRYCTVVFDKGGAVAVEWFEGNY